MNPNPPSSGINAPIGRCCLGPQCNNPNHELRDTHRCPGCSGLTHVLCGTIAEDCSPPGADKEKEKGKVVTFCPPCHDKRDSVSSPLIPPNADANLLLGGSPDTQGRRRPTPKRLAMNDEHEAESKEEADAPYSVEVPPNQNMDLDFLKTIESIDDNSSIRLLGYEEL